MAIYTTPGSYINESKLVSLVPTVNGPTSAVFFGEAARGPLVPTLINDWPTYKSLFGDLDASYELGYAVYHYFANGGGVAWVVALDGGPPGTMAFRAALPACFDAGGPVDAIDRFDLLCVPGETDPATQTVLLACCAARRAFLIADCVADATVSSLAQGPDPRLVGPYASHAALYAPWVVVLDAAGDSRNVPPSPFVAGILARIDAQRGVWKAPAGVEATLVGANSLAVSFDARASDAINAAGINALRALPGKGFVVWGARTLAAPGGDSQYRYVSVRRLMLHIESSLDAGLHWTVLESNTERTWAVVRRSVEDFLDGLWRAGALAGARREQATFVRCDRTTMTQADSDAGRLIVEIGVAPVRPAEFIVVRLVCCTATS